MGDPHIFMWLWLAFRVFWCFGSPHWDKRINNATRPSCLIYEPIFIIIYTWIQIIVLSFIYRLMKSVTRYLLSSLTPHFANKSLGSSIQGHHWLRVPNISRSAGTYESSLPDSASQVPPPSGRRGIEPQSSDRELNPLIIRLTWYHSCNWGLFFRFFYFPIANSQLFFSSGLIFEPTKGLYGFHFYQSSQRLGCHPN